MHMLIRALVYATDKDEALEKAKSDVFAKLVGEEEGYDSVFDYYTTFEHQGSVVAGEGRWGKHPYAMRADSKEGKEWIREGMEATKKDYLLRLTRLRKILKKHTNERVWKMKHRDSDVDFQAWCVGQDKGSHTWLYDHQGSGIRSDRHLKSVIDGWPNDKGEKDAYCEEPLWVVPADVHY